MESILDVQTLPHQNSTQVKNQWGAVRRLVRKSGAVAITDRANVEMVLVDAQQFEKLTQRLRAAEEKDQRVLTELSRQFDERLRVLSDPGVGKKIDDVFATRGKQKVRAKVGAF